MERRGDGGWWVETAVADPEGRGPGKSFADGCGDLGGVKRCLDGTSYKPDRRGNGKSERLCASSKTRPHKAGAPRTVSLPKPINR